MADLEKARRKAQELIRKYSTGKPPVDPEAFARREQLRVEYVTFNGPARQEISGYIKPEAGKIVVNIEQPSERKTYAIAHELGHYLLHPGYIKSDEYRPLSLPEDTGKTDSKEQEEANAFAAELLVPLNMLRSYRSFAAPAELAKMFVVPPELILNRLSQIAA